MSEKICPRCGEKYSYIERRKTKHNTYFYAVHAKWSHGKGFKRRCYLGPKFYDYTSRLHKDLNIVFSGILDSDRLIRYVYSLTSELLKADLEPNRARAMANHLEEVARNLRIKAFKREFES